MCDQKLVDDAVENAEPASQTKAELAPQTIFTRRTWRVMLPDLRHRLDAFVDVTPKVIPREGQHGFDRGFVIDLHETIRKLCLPQPYHLVETRAQTFFRLLVGCVALAKTMNHRAL